MKIKTIAKALACATALSVAVCSSAFAASPSVEATKTGSNISVTYSGVEGQMTMLAFDITDAYAALTDKSEATGTNYDSQEIVYVTQEAVGTSKTFALKDGYAPASENDGSKFLLVKVGGTNIDAPGAAVVEVAYQAGTEFMYGDVDMSGEIDMDDAFEILAFVQGKASWTKDDINFAAADVAEEYGEIDMDDAFEVLAFIQGKIAKFEPADENGYGIFTGAASVEAAAAEEIDAEADEVVSEEPTEEVVADEEVSAEESVEETEEVVDETEEAPVEESETEVAAEEVADAE